MIPVAEAQARVLSQLKPLPTEHVPLEQAAGRVLSEAVVARVTHPPADTSAMDGYAVACSDRRDFRVAGVSSAGAGFHRPCGAGEAVRIFTGAPVPEGADCVVIQENVSRAGDQIVLASEVQLARRQHIRTAGNDFRAGDLLLEAGRRLSGRDIALAAAMNHATLPCARKPRVAILANGDELVLPGEYPARDQIVSSSPFGLAAEIALWGGAASLLGIARDNEEDIRSKLSDAHAYDLVVTIGGASVGEHDLIKSALARELVVDFWKIAMRPGKPLVSGTYRGVPMLGLPGNPVSAFVCAQLFIKPAVYRMIGATADPLPLVDAQLVAGMPANDARQDYCRARVDLRADGELLVTPLPVQDSGMLRALSMAQGLVVRPPYDPPRMVGDTVAVLLLEPLFFG